uniref:O-methyltransferase C-terminal domain-containing protein n=1 Tax=Solanum lycopersicum TaxID=4081 RepID=A0A494G8B2_SOLLC
MNELGKYSTTQHKLTLLAHKLYHKAMGSDVRSIISVFTINGNGVFEGLKTLVDDTRTVAKTISNVVEGLEGGNNLKYIGGDMYKSVPSAHAILNVLHDWSDEDFVKILKKCTEAIPSKENGGKVIDIDIKIDNAKRDNKSFKTQLFSDVLVLFRVSGKTEK